MLYSLPLVAVICMCASSTLKKVKSRKLIVRSDTNGINYMDKGGAGMEAVSAGKYNCSMCKNAKMCLLIGNICLGEKFCGKVIKYDDAICDEFEFGGFIELLESIQKIPARVI